MACIFMKNMKDKSQVTRAYEIVQRALLDPETRLSKAHIHLSVTEIDTK